jgi:hypothetical protein
MHYLYWIVGIVLFDFFIVPFRVLVPPFSKDGSPDNCACGKTFVPKMLPFDAPEGYIQVTLVTLLIVFVLIPIFIPQEMVWRYFHNKKCLPFHMKRMEKKDETR